MGKYTEDHQELQRLLARELQEQELEGLSAEDADMLAYSLADVALGALISAVKRETQQRTKRRRLLGRRR